jgi:hypothetical protein
MRNSFWLVFFSLCVFVGNVSAQVDTSYVYNTNTPYGGLDIRIAKSATRYYHLEEGKTFSFRETSAGVRTNTYRDMTAWDSSPYEEGNLRERDGAVDNFVMNYRLLKPQGYDPNYAKGYPIIIMMHGSGEHGNCWHSRCYHSTEAYSPVVNDPPAPTNAEHELLNNDHSLLHGGKVYLDAVELAGNRKPDDPDLADAAFPGFILFPQNLNGWNNNSVQDAIRVLRLIIKKYNIDEDRVYINGLSQGAHGVLEAVKRAPWLFSAVIVMSAVDDGFITSANLESTVAGIPMWYFQGELDTTPYPAKTRSYINKFRNAGAVIRYTEYEGVGHTTWNLAYKEPDFFTWMLGKSKSQVHTFAGSTAICSGSSGLQLRMPEGHLAYQWQRNGSIINGATSPVYVAKEPGIYRGRFSRVAYTPSESQWNEWSENISLGTAQAGNASIRQLGTVLLRDLNNGNIAYMESQDEAAHYYWFKDGNLLNLPGDQDDTLRLVKISAGDCSDGSCAGNGSYTLVTSSFDQCKSTPSVPKQIFFSDQAPVNITAPGNFTSSDATASTLKLSWTDNSNNEGGFEIWRRQKLASGYSAWSMATLTDANIKTFIDSRLMPVTEYQYKIRAVSASGRSDYSPKDNVLVATTAEDTQPPLAPENLKVTRRDIDRAYLTWSPATDNSGISKYILNYNGETAETTDTTFTTEPLELNKRFDFSLKAVDLRNNEGPEATGFITTHFYGLYYEHSPGAFPYVDSIDFASPEYTGYLSALTLKRKTQEDYYYFRFKGYLYINSTGTYQFRTTSDDGSRLYIKGQRIVNNDGIHQMKTITSGTITLQEGPQKFQLDFFDYTKSDSVVVEYKGPDTGNSWKVIDSYAFRSTLVVSTESPDEEGIDIDVFPNPTTQDNINVKIAADLSKPIVITLLDPMGRLIHSEVFGRNNHENGTLRINPQHSLMQGLYLLKVVRGDKVIVKRVIIQR